MSIFVAKGGAISATGGAAEIARSGIRVAPSTSTAVTSGATATTKIVKSTGGGGTAYVPPTTITTVVQTPATTGAAQVSAVSSTVPVTRLPLAPSIAPTVTAPSTAVAAPQTDYDVKWQTLATQYAQQGLGDPRGLSTYQITKAMNANIAPALRAEYVAAKTGVAVPLPTAEQVKAVTTPISFQEFAARGGVVSSYPTQFTSPVAPAGVSQSQWTTLTPEARQSTWGTELTVTPTAGPSFGVGSAAPSKISGAVAIATGQGTAGQSSFWKDYESRVAGGMLPSVYATAGTPTGGTSKSFVDKLKGLVGFQLGSLAMSYGTLGARKEVSTRTTFISEGAEKVSETTVSTRPSWKGKYESGAGGRYITDYLKGLVTIYPLSTARTGTLTREDINKMTFGTQDMSLKEAAYTSVRDIIKTPYEVGKAVRKSEAAAQAREKELKPQVEAVAPKLTADIAAFEAKSKAIEQERVNVDLTNEAKVNAFNKKIDEINIEQTRLQTSAKDFSKLATEYETLGSRKTTFEQAYSSLGNLETPVERFIGKASLVGVKGAQYAIETAAATKVLGYGLSLAGEVATGVGGAIKGAQITQKLTQATAKTFPKATQAVSKYISNYNWGEIAKDTGKVIGTGLILAPIPIGAVSAMERSEALGASKTEAAFVGGFLGTSQSLGAVAAIGPRALRNLYVTEKPATVSYVKPSETIDMSRLKPEKLMYPEEVRTTVYKEPIVPRYIHPAVSTTEKEIGDISKLRVIKSVAPEEVSYTIKTSTELPKIGGIIKQKVIPTTEVVGKVRAVEGVQFTSEFAKTSGAKRVTDIVKDIRGGIRKGDVLLVQKTPEVQRNLLTNEDVLTGRSQIDIIRMRVKELLGKEISTSEIGGTKIGVTGEAKGRIVRTIYPDNLVVSPKQNVFRKFEFVLEGKPSETSKISVKTGGSENVPMEWNAQSRMATLVYPEQASKIIPGLSYDIGTTTIKPPIVKTPQYSIVPSTYKGFSTPTFNIGKKVSKIPLVLRSGEFKLTPAEIAVSRLELPGYAKIGSQATKITAGEALTKITPMEVRLPEVGTAKMLAYETRYGGRTQKIGNRAFGIKDVEFPKFDTGEGIGGGGKGGISGGGTGSAGPKQKLILKQTAETITAQPVSVVKPVRYVNQPTTKTITSPETGKVITFGRAISLITGVPTYSLVNLGSMQPLAVTQIPVTPVLAPLQKVAQVLTPLTTTTTITTNIFNPITFTPPVAVPITPITPTPSAPLLPLIPLAMPGLSFQGSGQGGPGRPGAKKELGYTASLRAMVIGLRGPKTKGLTGESNLFSGQELRVIPL